MKPAVCILDDDAATRNAMKLLFKSKGIPFAAFATPREFYEGYSEKPFCCVILDHKMPGATGLEVLREMRVRNILVPVIMLSGHADVSLTVEAMKAGAVDVLEKPVDNAILVEKVQDACLKAEALRKLAEERTAIEPKFSSLTPREIQVLDHMVAGQKNRVIADALGISPKTLDIHRANIMRKMQTKAVADLVRWRMVNQADPSGVMRII